MNYFEVIGTVFGLISVWLTVKQKIISWPAGIISVISFAILFWQIKLYADMGLQLFYVATGFYGWYLWKYGGNNKTELKVATLTYKEKIILFLLFIPSFYLIGLYLKNYTDAALPMLDSFTSTLSIFAQILLMKKIFENWFCWITVDIFSIGIYLYKGVFLTAGLYAVFLCLATAGLIGWYKSYKKYETENNGLSPREVRTIT